MNKVLNDYLAEVVTNSSICQYCRYNHNNICFFAYNCIRKDFKYYNEEEEEEEE